MKNIIILLLVFISTNLVNAQKELVWHEDMEEAIKISEKTGKPLMLFFTGSDWCGWCIKLQKEVFQKPEFRPWADKNVVLVDLDFPSKKPQDQKIKKQNEKLAEKFSIRGYPTVVFVTPLKKNKEYELIEIGEGSARSGYMRGGAEVWCQDASQKLSGGGK